MDWACASNSWKQQIILPATWVHLNIRFRWDRGNKRNITEYPSVWRSNLVCNVRNRSRRHGVPYANLGRMWDLEGPEFCHCSGSFQTHLEYFVLAWKPHLVRGMKMLKQACRLTWNFSSGPLVQPKVVRSARLLFCIAQTRPALKLLSNMFNILLSSAVSSP